ncbi:MAG: TolC family protein, partial [Burkholderiales bacterium]
MKNYPLFLLLSLLSSFPAHAADLLEIYHQALAQDAVYASARATWQAGLEKLPQGRALLLPALNLSGNTIYNDYNTRIRGTSVLQG